MLSLIHISCGYLLESRTQAIVLLPDLPEELRIQLPGTQRRLAEKFGLTPVPVSYTHLDVYKRQVITDIKLYFKTNI